MRVDPRLKAVFDTLGQADMRPILVGGAVRDLLLGRAVNDYDFVVGARPQELIEAIKELSCAAGCTVIPLDKERGVIRYCFSADFFVDVAVWQGESLEADLRLRDFTINAMAMDDQEQLIDPTGGQTDLDAGLVRMVSESALQDDPLRVLRGLRLASVLGFELEEATATALVRQAPGLERVAGERIASELFKFMAYAGWELWELFRAADVPRHGWAGQTPEAAWVQLESWLKTPDPALGQLQVRDQRTDRELALLGFLWGQQCDLGERLKLSGAELKYLQRWSTAREALSRVQQFTVGEVYQLCKLAGDALAGAVSFWTGPQAIRERLLKAARGEGELRWEPLPLNGGELVQQLELKPGPRVGEMLAELERAWVCGECETAEQLWERARAIVNSY